MRFLPQKFCCFAKTRVHELVLCAVGLVAFVHIFNRLGLYADGSHSLLLTLAHRSYGFFGEPRGFVLAAFHTPVLLAIWSGVKNIDWLIGFYSFGLFAFPAVFWIGALDRVKREPWFWPFVVAYSVVYLNTGLVGAGEYNLAYAIVALSMAFLISRRPIRRTDSLVLLAAAVILLCAYEALVYLGPLLFAAASLRLARQEEPGRTESLCILSAAFCYAAAAGIAASSILHPQIPENLANAASLHVLVTNRQIVFSVLISLLYVVFWVLRGRGVVARKAGHLSLILAWLLIVPLVWAPPIQHYFARTVAGGTMLVLFGMLAWARFWNCGLANEDGALSSSESALARKIPLVMFAMLLVPNLCLSFGFGGYATRFRNEVNAATGFVELKDTHFTRLENAVYGWCWTYPSMSLLLRRDEQAGIILNAPRWRSEPFDPHESSFDLREYYGTP